MLVSIVLLAATLSVAPRLFREQSARTMQAVISFVRQI
jgi:hypothetical protein